MQFLKGPVATVLCVSLVCPTVPAQTSATVNTTRHSNAMPDARSEYHAHQIEGDARILHALNRFTFGPRPGDVETVRTMGLEKWFDQQLHPQSIQEAELTARLAEFPAMQWSPEELLFRAPSNGIIRQVINGKLTMPKNGALRAVYEDQIYRFNEKRQKKAAEEQKQTSAAASTQDKEMLGSDTPPRGQAGDSNQMAPAPNAGEAAAADEGDLRQLLALAPQPRVSELARMQPERADTFFKSLKPRQRVLLLQDLPPDLKEVVLDLEGPQRLVTEEMVAQRLTRDIYSNAQLQEVMTDFWLNHFNIFLHKNEAMPYYLVSFERDVIRPRALGKFEDLLEATAHSPAMLLYLDNAESIGPDSLAAERAEFRQNNKKKHEGLNENYARELMELHTLGVNGGYTQADVTQVARVLTGWTVDRPQRGGGFQFDERRHEPGTKIVMGKKFKDRGEQEGRELLHMLATRPATAKFLSRKLAVRFVSDDPPQALVDRMAKTFLSSGGDISAVLSTMFHSPEFWDASVYRAKVKTPIEFVASAVRATNADVGNMMPLANAARAMGMPLYGCVTPNGYSWTAETWVSTNALINRMNFSLALAANRLPGISVAWDPADKAGNDKTTSPATPEPGAEEARLEALLIAGGVSDSTRGAVLQQFEQQHTKAENAPVPVAMNAPDRQRFGARAASGRERQDQLLAGLLIGSPEFQRR